MALTVVSPVKVTLQRPVPEQPPPLQPVKVDPLSADAVRVTTEPAWKPAEQVFPQSIPEGLEVTVPPPAPALETVRET